jgi:hypothetical protein
MSEVNEPIDAPQADRLDLVRRVVEAVHHGQVGTDAIAAYARIAQRYVQYAVQSARLLELLRNDDAGEVVATELALKALATARGSKAERAILRSGFEQASAFSDVKDLVLAAEAPTSTSLAEVLLLRRTPIALSTALRRARTLLAWRRYLIEDDGSQLRLADLEPSLDDEESPPPEPPEALADGAVLPLFESVVSSEADETMAALQASASADEPRALPDSVEPPPPNDTATVASTDSPARIDDPHRQSPIDHNDLAYLRRHTEQGNLVLMTGAGFSLGARDTSGNKLPDGATFAGELWQICYPEEPRDSSSLQDIFEHAARAHRRILEGHLRARFSVDAASLPDWYTAWFAFPWFKYYTLNVDDLAAAVARRAELPRTLRTISAVTGTATGATAALDQIHLNGRAVDGASGVTFSTQQYADRLAHGDAFYLQLRAELLTAVYLRRQSAGGNPPLAAPRNAWSAGQRKRAPSQEFPGLADVESRARGQTPYPQHRLDQGYCGGVRTRCAFAASR